MPYANIRTVTFKFYGEHDVPPMPDSEPEIVILSEMPTLPGITPDLEEIGRYVEESIRESMEEFHSVPNYIMQDHRNYSEWGASGGGQDVIIQMVMDPGVREIVRNLGASLIQGGANGTGSFLAQEVLNKIRGSFRRQREQSREAFEEPIPTEKPDLDLALMRAKSSIQVAYGVMWEDLDVEHGEVEDGLSVIVLKHGSSGRRFNIKVDSLGNTMSISPIIDESAEI